MRVLSFLKSLEQFCCFNLDILPVHGSSFGLASCKSERWGSCKGPPLPRAAEIMSAIGPGHSNLEEMLHFYKGVFFFPFPSEKIILLLSQSDAVCVKEKYSLSKKYLKKKSGECQK